VAIVAVETAAIRVFFLKKRRRFWRVKLPQFAQFFNKEVRILAV
jgi:hypothetical protein